MYKDIALLQSTFTSDICIYIYIYIFLGQLLIAGRCVASQERKASPNGYKPGGHWKLWHRKWGRRDTPSPHSS